MFVFPDERFTMCPPDDAENYRTRLQGEQDENKKETAFSIRFLNNAEKKRSAFSSGALFVLRRRCANQLQ